MGISHPLSDEFYGPRGGGVLLSPERTPPSSPPPASCCSAVDQDFMEHEVSRMDTLAGIAIKYGVEISDIKRANGLVSDSQMFAHKALLIPLPGRPMPSSVRLNGSSQRSKRAWAPNHQQNRDVEDSLDSCKSGQQQSSLAMSNLQSYYGLDSQRGDYSTEMSLYSKGSPQRIGTEALLDYSSPLDSMQSTGRSQDSEDTTNGASGTKGNGATKAKQDGSIRRRQKVESDHLSNTTDTQDDLLSDSIKMIKSFLPKPLSSIRLNMDTSSPDPTAKSNGSLLSGFKSVRKSPSAPNFADSENGISMWSSSKWTFNHESFTRPLLDGLPKPSPARRAKAALD
ncbi:lysM and putative peptidoglycan-binding domain-containing protein 1 [Brachypodium distachyon]|nr:lysM and putative peptidoglycan-binding domain-containing protein 1 [Brachypodium distachyon]|eukprot:XP_003563221.1 lysM and putative peptidoglycan-binding domain-containing protein 1 [Brachypodium distachyon]